MKTVLITGANKGIGFEVARQLMKKGFQVIISGRDERKLSEAFNQLNVEGTSLEKIIMDVSRYDSVKEAAQILSASNFTLDVIINNAGILLKEDRSLLEHDDEILKNTINTNCYGPIRVIHAFQALIKSPGRIINLSSEGGSMSDPVGGWSPAYCVSKTMLNALTRQLAYELSARNIAVNAVTPGWVKTDMGGRYATRPVEKGAETIVWLASEARQELTGRFFKDKVEISW